MESQDGRGSRDGGKTEHEDRRTPPSPILKRRLVDLVWKQGIRGYEATHNALFELRERYAQTEEDRQAEALEELARLARRPRPDAAASAPGTDESGGWGHHFTPPSTDECWNLVSHRALLTDFQALKMCVPLFRTQDWNDEERVTLVGKRLVQLVKDRVVRVALARRVSPNTAAAALDQQIKLFFDGNQRVGTGKLPALLHEAINDVTMAAHSGTDPLARSAVLGGSRPNQQNQ